LEYSGGIIEDEDMGPADRAADRAERFSGYRDKRTDDATGHADQYESGPQAHGYQSEARAERAAARHDRVADRAGDAWSKAEYWQRRTAGVIAHALHLAAPGVRMGRIKTLEAELRKAEKTNAECAERFESWRTIAAMTDPEKQTEHAEIVSGYGYGFTKYIHPRTGKESSLWDMLREDAADRITGAEAAALYMAKHRDPLLPEFQETSLMDWITHYKLRLGYENQMLAAQGGRMEQSEVLIGGKIGGKLILKASKSSVTKRVTSVKLMGPKVGSGWHYQVSNIPGTEFAEYHFDTERLNPSSYTPPTPESLAELAAFKASQKAAAPVKAVCPLVNPTNEDAERLQSILNERAKEEHEKRNTYTSESGRAMHSAEFKPSAVLYATQASYSHNSKGSYAAAGTRGLFAGGIFIDSYYNAAEKMRAKHGREVCQVRQTSGDGYNSPRRVIVLTDKPQKALPSSVWETYTPAPVAAVPSAVIKCSACGIDSKREAWDKTSNALFPAAIVCPACDMHHAETNADHTAPTISQTVNA
jgi:hypothetical protein